jgi:EmrB/QacA subfamily drug resistance transporter
MSQQTTLPADVRGQDSPTRPHPGLILAILVTCQLMLILDLTVMNVALPRIQAGLGFSATSLSWVISAYALAYGGLLLLGGRIGDRVGRRRTFVAGVAVFTLASLVGGFATNAAWLLAARTAQGVGAAIAGPSALALLTVTFTEPRARIRALSVFSAVASGGFAIGLVLGGALTEWASWRWVLFINVPFGLVLVLLAPRRLPNTPPHPGRLDIPGAVTATTGMAALVYAFIRAAADGWGNGLTLGAFAAAAVLLGAFFTLAVRSADPLIPLRLFSDRNRAGAYLNMLLGPAAMLAMFYFLTQFLQEVLGFSALRTGFAFLPMAVAMFSMTRVLPRVLPRYGPKPVVIAGCVLMLTGLGWLASMTPDSGYSASILGPLVLMGVGGGLGFAPLNVVIMNNVRPTDAGAASGMLQTMQQVGGSLGLAILVTVFGSASRHAAAHPAAGVHGVRLAHVVLADGVSAAFLGGTVFAAASLLVAFTFRHTRPADEPAGR